MACYSPIGGWYSKTKNPSGKRSIVFNPREAYTDLRVELPCGKCIGCKADQALMWSIRCYHESQEHYNNCFATLTYAEENYPKDGRISKRDLQLFFKRLRKKMHPVGVRYLACGEYGDTTRRAHYHAIIFGVDFLHDSIKINERLYTSPTLEKIWGLGQVTLAPVTMSSICYTAGYVVKKMKDEDTFVLMSRRPGIGKNWLDTYLPELKQNGFTVIEGRQYTIPTRYLQWKEEELKHVKLARKQYAIEQEKLIDPVERRKQNNARETNRNALIKQKQETL